MPVASLKFRRAAKGAGTVVLGLLALDLIATAITFAFGVEFFNK